MIPPLDQKYFDDNRERFDAETTNVPKEVSKCNHYLVRVDSQRVRCKNCSAGWIMPISEVLIEDGRPV